MSLVLQSSGGGSVTLQEPTTASNLTLDIAAAAGTLSPLVSGTEQATTSGTSKDFTGIPSWVKRITIMFSGISLSGTSSPLIQIGTSSSVETSDYVSGSTATTATAGGTLTSTAGFLMRFNLATISSSGHMILTNMGSDTWISSHSVRLDSTACAFGGGEKTLSGTLTRIRLTTVNGTDTFDAGSVNILYE